MSLKPSLHNMKPSAAAMRRPLKLKTNGQKSDPERALQPRRRLLSALVAAATLFMSSKIQLMVRLLLKLRPLLTLKPTFSNIVSWIARSPM